MQTRPTRAGTQRGVSRAAGQTVLNCTEALLNTSHASDKVFRTKPGGSAEPCFLSPPNHALNEGFMVFQGGFVSIPKSPAS